MTTTAPRQAPLAARPRFDGDVVVRRCDYVWWRTEQEISYFDGERTWVAPKGTRTDFASVPRLLTWLIPRTGRWDKAAIVHDRLCSHPDEQNGGVTRAKADELFRHMLRHLEVAFLRRWFMWGAVRLTSIFRDPPGPPRGRQLGLVLLLLLAALPVAIAPVVAIMAGLLVFFALEWLTYPLLALAHRLRGRPGKVNPPVWSWRI
ncbi:MAG TPA: DUF1353 domain-containing protein [Miltoncostaeaceae bacterium]|nr:DUF1353 domain-containing protein [Miltoncostaeaceae bacterium]